MSNKSAFELAKEVGYKGTEAEWLDQFRTHDEPVTKAQYQQATSRGYVGTFDEYVEYMATVNLELDLSEMKLTEETKDLHAEDVREMENNDAGIKARDKLVKKPTVLSKLSGLLHGLIYALILVMGFAILYVVDNKTNTVESYSTECSLPLDSHIDITGNRHYRYQVSKMLGMTFRLDKNVETKLTLQPTFNETTITTIKDNTFSSVYIGKGEPTTLTIKEGDTYVFTQGKKTWVSTAGDFCR